MTDSPARWESEPDTPHCQSCSRPMLTEADFGTERDLEPSPDYCSCCMQNGAWTEPDVTMQELAERCVDIWVENRLADRPDARRDFAALFPTLKRWR